MTRKKSVHVQKRPTVVSLTVFQFMIGLTADEDHSNRKGQVCGQESLNVDGLSHDYSTTPQNTVFDIPDWILASEKKKMNHFLQFVTSYYQFLFPVTNCLALTAFALSSSGAGELGYPFLVLCKG